MGLATSNFSVSALLAALGLATAKDIFYLSGSLRTISNFGTVVNKYGLHSTYCPGSTPDARLQNLLTDRNLSYFKGYFHFEIQATPQIKNVSSAAGSYLITVVSSCDWTVSEAISWANASPMSGSADQAVTITYSLNSSGSSRNGTITFATVGGGMTTQHILTQSP